MKYSLIFSVIYLVSAQTLGCANHKGNTMSFGGSSASSSASSGVGAGSLKMSSKQYENGGAPTYQQALSDDFFTKAPSATPASGTDSGPRGTARVITTSGEAQ